MRAIVLAAGRGRRLGALADDRPKCLTRLAGETLIGRQLATLRDGGIDDIVVVNGYRREMLRPEGTREVHNPDWETTNMVETLFCAAHEFSDDMIVAYADIVYAPRVLAALLASPHDVSVIVDRNWRPYWEARFDDPLSDAESLSTDGAGRITDIGNPPGDIDAIEGQYIGLMRFRGHGVAALRAARRALGSVNRPWMKQRPVERAYMTDLLMEMILRGVDIHAVGIESGWLELDTPRDLETARRIIAGEAFAEPAKARQGA